MNWILNNWSFLVVVACVLGLFAIWTTKFAKLPSESQKKVISEWLLWAVIEAEKLYSTGTGVVKLRYVYNLFIEKFPSLVTVITFEMFSKMVDEALEQMRHLLETNKDIESYVNGD